MNDLMHRAQAVTQAVELDVSQDVIWRELPPLVH